MPAASRAFCAAPVTAAPTPLKKIVVPYAVMESVGEPHVIRNKYPPVSARLDDPPHVGPTVTWNCRSSSASRFASVELPP